MQKHRRFGASQAAQADWQTPTGYPGQREKGERAFRAYLDLLEAAECMRNRVRGQFEILDLTFRQFQVLEMLERRGTMEVVEVAERLRCNRQNVEAIVRRLAAKGWLEKQVVNLPPAEIAPTDLPKARRGKVTAGKKAGILSLSEMGKAYMKNVLQRHKKVVKAFMRALDGREQTSLSAICQKLILGDPMKFISEMEFEDVEE